MNDRYESSTGEESPERGLTAFLRWAIMVPADPREVDIPGAFMRCTIPTGWKPSQFGHYPEHWYSHIMHCFEVIGYCHPDADVAARSLAVYHRFVRNLHLEP